MTNFLYIRMYKQKKCTEIGMRKRQRAIQEKKAKKMGPEMNS